MTIIINTLIFLLGMSICVQLVAALFGIIDQWYTIKTAYPMVIRRIATWILITGLLGWLLGDHLRTVFLKGVIGYLVFYVFTYWGYQLLFLRNTRLLGLRERNTEK